MKRQLASSLEYCCEFDLVHRPCEWATSAAHVLMLIVSGEGLLCWKRNPKEKLHVDGEKSFLHYLPAGQWRFVDVLGERPAHIVALHFEAKHESGLDFSDCCEIDELRFNDQKADLRRLLLEIAARYESYDFRDQLECERLFRAALGRFFEALKQKENCEPPPKAKRCQAAISHLVSNWREKIDIDELASLCRVSRPHFFVLFKKETGVTAQKFLCNLRIEEAKKLLLFTNDPVSEIGQAVGWPDQFHFSRTFSRETGRSPSEFRNMAKT